MRLPIMICLLALFILSCKKVLKNPEDYYPEVEMVSTEIQPDGRLLVFGRVINPGKYKGTKISNIGFCMKHEGVPKMYENQIQATGFDGTNFYAYYPDFYFNDNSIYYFSAFATNDYGYHLSDAKPFDSLFLDISPPCTINEMYYNTMGMAGYYDYVQNNQSDNQYIANHGNRSFMIQFPGAIRAGIYKTHTNFNEPNRVKCSINNTTSIVIPNNQEVFVEKTSSTSFKVTICALDVVFMQDTLNYKGSFNINL